MAGSVNKVILIGNLGRDPEVRFTRSGDKVASFSLATSEVWKDKHTGERRERTEWHRVVIFNERLCDVVEQYLRKGAKVYLEGQLATRKWTGNDDQERTTTEVVLQRYRGELHLLDRRNGSGPPPADSQDDYGTARTAGSPASEAAPPNGGTPPDAPLPNLDDDIPF